jgi:hypothetical protein
MSVVFGIRCRIKDIHTRSDTKIECSAIAIGNQQFLNTQIGTGSASARSEKCILIGTPLTNGSRRIQNKPQIAEISAVSLLLGDHNIALLTHQFGNAVFTQTASGQNSKK